ncbi:Na/H antiporter [Pochonia chlamydosporia 170]|uniref:Na/H antiporter n=1 Tax=Pochonia chlamydosporia 170 TaxID=1380566 RepID=A0A179F662_METCM|nr:Na/H antiporter [Pochonia chlamydosporia 170]OAQ60927.1 Na/H antiporter [Pochonia chlamydosporia 170]
MANNIWAIPLAVTDFNVIIALLGGYISLFGLVSYLLKETYYMSEALISLLVGVAFGPHAANWIRPWSYAACHRDGLTDAQCDDRLMAITLNFSRLVLGVQLVLAGVQLPSKYLWKQLKPVLLLVGPGMTCMWMATSLIVWGLVGTPSFLHALAVGACVTPTDPVLSAVIVKGKFADHNIPKDLQDLIVAESGANDGLGYAFLFFALYLTKYMGVGSTEGGAGDAMGLWFAFTWGYTIILSIIYGAVVGWVAKELLHFAEERNYVDRENFLVFAIALALFVLGTCGMIGTDDVLACFIAGNTFTWDDWFRLQTKDDSLQPTVDMLLNVSIFLWYGAYLPWKSFANNSIIPLSRLIPLGLLVLILRRLPWVFGMHTWIRQIREVRQAIFVGFFGPIGVSAIFYLFISIEFIEEHLSNDDGVPRKDVKDLAETITIVVWFLAVCSIVVHGLSIPLGKLGYLAPRIHRVLSESLSESLSNQNPIEAGRGIPILRRLFSPPPEDPEANLATRVRQGTASIARTGCGALPSKIKENDQETRGEEPSAANGNETSEGSSARTDGEAETGGPGTWTPARSGRREVVFFDEVIGGAGPRGR